MTSAVPKMATAAAIKRFTLFSRTSSKNNTGRKMIPCGFMSTAAVNNAADKLTFFSVNRSTAKTTIIAKKESTCPQNVELMKTAGLKIYAADNKRLHSRERYLTANL